MRKPAFVPSERRRVECVRNVRNLRDVAAPRRNHCARLVGELLVGRELLETVFVLLSDLACGTRRCDIGEGSMGVGAVAVREGQQRVAGPRRRLQRGESTICSIGVVGDGEARRSDALDAISCPVTCGMAPYFTSASGSALSFTFSTRASDAPPAASYCTTYFAEKSVAVEPASFSASDTRAVYTNVCGRFSVSRSMISRATPAPER